MASNRTSSSRRNLKLILGAPLLLLSVAAHGLVLSLPVPGGWEETPAESQEEATSQAPESVQVVRLPVAAPQPAPKAAPTERPKAAAAPASAPARPQPAPQPTPTADPEDPEVPQPDPAPEEAVLELDPLPAQPPPVTLEDRLHDPTSYAFNNQAKDAEAAVPDFLAWYVNLPAQTDGTAVQMSNQALDPLRVKYPLTTCLTPEPTTGRLAVIINTDGNLNQEPEVLGSTGYTILDEQALAAVSHYTFPKSGELTAYGLPVEVEYDAATCTPPAPDNPQTSKQS